MRLTLLVAAMLIGTGTAAQAAVYAFASNNSSTWDQERPLEASVDTGATYQGIWTVDDFQTNQARASANARYGEMRIFARDAGDDNITASGARARIEDTLTITGPQGGVPVTATLRMRAEADLNTLTNQTGGPVGGRADTQFWSELSVSAERTPVFNRSPVEHRGSVGFRHLAGHGFVRGENDSIIEEVIPSGPTILERGRITPTRFRGGTPSENPVQATRLDFERNAVGNVAALMEVDFLVSPGDTFGVRGFIYGMATGAPGHGATVNGENTGRMFLDLPEGYGFTAETDGFLANQSPLGSPTPVPLPGTGLLMAGAVGSLLRARRRRG